MKEVVGIVFLILVVSSCGNNKADNQHAYSAAISGQPASIVVGIAKIAPEQDILQLSSAVNGIVKKIYNIENDTVQPGTIIMELDHDLEDDKIEQLQNQVKTQIWQIKAEEASIDEMAAKQKNAVKDLNRFSALLKTGSESEQNVDNAATNVASIAASLNRLNSLKEVSRSKLEELKSALRLAVSERDQKIIRSPVKGKILEITSLIGESVDTRQYCIQICPDGKIIAMCEIDENNAALVRIGQTAWIRNVGSSDTLSRGTVYFTANFLKKKSLFMDLAGEKEDRRVRTVKVLLEKREHLLLNSRVECVIDVSPNI